MAFLAITFSNMRTFALIAMSAFSATALAAEFARPAASATVR